MDGGVQYFVGAFCGFEFLATAFCTWQLYKQRSAFLQRICHFFFSLQDCRNRTIKENKINEGDMDFSLGSSELVDFSWFMTRGVGCGVRYILHVPPKKIWQGWWQVWRKNNSILLFSSRAFWYMLTRREMICARMFPHRFSWAQLCITVLWCI